MNWSSHKSFVTVAGHQMAYVEEGSGTGPPIVFVHGNPTSSYLWRNILPEVSSLGRCLAVDLIGMGDSDSLPRAEASSSRYSFETHRQFFAGFLDAVVGDTPVILVLHDWGSALGFDWGASHPDQVLGIAYMESVVQGLRWDDFEPDLAAAFRAVRSSDGDRLIVEENLFVEQTLPSSMLRTLLPEEMDEYRRPFLDPDRREVILSWAQLVPIDSHPPEVSEVVETYASWLAQSPVPKLLVLGDHGVLIRPDSTLACRNWPNQREVQVSGSHFLQEDSPAEIAAAVTAWVQEVTGRN